MKLSLFDVVCAGCELTFKAPDIAPNAYGEFLLRSDGAGEARYLNALQDRTYVEVEALLRAEARVVALAPVRRAKLLQDVFGPVACDPDASGAPLRIGVNAGCPACGSQQRRSWDASSPLEFVEVDVPVVSHEEWSRLSVAQKSARVREATANILIEGLD